MKDEEVKSFKDDVFQHETVLPSGIVFTFKTALARDVLKARKLIDKDEVIEEVAEFALIAACSMLNGTQGLPTDYGDLTMTDYIDLIKAWNTVNFLSASVILPT